MSRVSAPLSALLEQMPGKGAELVRAFSSQEDGTLPLLMNGSVWLSTSSGSGEQHLVLLRNPSRLELEEWLETFRRGEACMLTDPSGRILAATESAGSLFSDFERATLEDFLDSISMTAFLTASSRCLAGERPRSFSVLTRKGRASRKSQVLSIGRTGLTDDLLLVSFSPPSMAMRTAGQGVQEFASNLFSLVPAPAIRTDWRGAVRAANRPALDMIDCLEGIGDNGPDLFDLVSEEDRERVSLLFGNRPERAVNPFRFGAGISLKDGTEGRFEVISVPMPDREGFMLFLTSERMMDSPDTDPRTKQVIGELLEMFQASEGREGYQKAVLEFIRTGTGAKGVTYVSRARRLTVGEASLPVREEQFRTLKEPLWTEDQTGHTVTIPVRQIPDSGLIRITGLPSRRPDHFSRLVMEMAAVFADYLRCRHQLETLSKMLGSVTACMEHLKGPERRIRAILETIGPIIEADFLVIHTVSSSEPVLRQLAFSGTASDPGELRIEMPSIASWAYAHQETCYVPDTALDQRFSPIFPSSRSEMSIPLICGGKTAGTLTIGSVRRDEFGHPAGAFMQILSTTLSLWLFGKGGDMGGQAAGSGDEREVSMQGLDDLMLSLSYRMKAPISAARAHLDLLSSGRLSNATDEGMRSIESIDSVLSDLTELMEGILGLLRMELRQDSLETVWARPADVLSSMLPAFSGRAERAEVSVTAELPSEPFTASFDRTRLERIVSSLVDNAIRYNRPGGNVRIGVRPDGTDHWILEVFNSGEGIPSDELPLIFDRFYTRTAGDGGTGLGLGLPIVKGFARQMGGTVNVRSRPGIGTWFTVRFPAN